MKKKIRIYDLHDPKQYEDEREYWASKTPTEKLKTVEILRQQYSKLTRQNGSAEQGLQRVYNIIKQTKD
ncbi:MAG: hypothetical protein WEA79_09315 [Balneolaceae bacterium]